MTNLVIHQPVEITGNLVVEHRAKDTASPGTWVGGVYVCACNGCWACKGYESGCTCDVDWDKVYGHD